MKKFLIVTLMIIFSFKLIFTQEDIKNNLKEIGKIFVSIKYNNIVIETKDLENGKKEIKKIDYGFSSTELLFLDNIKYELAKNNLNVTENVNEAEYYITLHIAMISSAFFMEILILDKNKKIVGKEIVAVEGLNSLGDFINLIYKSTNFILNSFRNLKLK